MFYVGLNSDGNIEAQGAGVAMDISTDGMMFESDDPIDVMQIVIQAASNNEEMMKVKGFLIYSMPFAEGRFRCALQFKDAPDRIARFVEALVGHAL